MPLTGRGGRQRRAGDVVGLLAVLLAVGGAVALGLGLRAQEPAPPQVPAAVDAATKVGGAGDPSAGTPADPSVGERSQEPGGPSRAGGGGSGDEGGRASRQRFAEPAVEQLDYSRPVSIRIPRIGVTSELVDLGVDQSGAMETPEPAELAGWFTPSPPPGIAGSTVIAGHVSWDKQPSVFFRLGELLPGDRVEVRRADRATTVFQVTRLGTFPKDGFPTAQVFDQPAQSELRLITCGGEFDAANGRHLSNIIVWARIVDVLGA